MKDLSIVLLAALGLFLLFNGKSVPATYTQEYLTADRVPPDVTQVIIEKLQAAAPDMAPLETLFINPQGDGTYLARFMFFNTRHYYGTQMDVKARVNSDGSVNILSQKDSAVTDYAKAYKPDMYQPYVEIQNNLDSQLKYSATQPITTPPLDAYKRA
jgi:hypothetical protein